MGFVWVLCISIVSGAGNTHRSRLLAMLMLHDIQKNRLKQYPTVLDAESNVQKSEAENPKRNFFFKRNVINNEVSRQSFESCAPHGPAIRG